MNPYEQYDRSYNARYRAQQRSLAYALLGNCCKYCGEDDPVVLEIDHINDDGGLYRRANGAKKGALDIYRDIVTSRIATDGLQLVCANCHLRQSHLRNTQKGV